MKVRNWVSFVFFLSSYAPLAPIIAFKDFAPKTWSLAHPTAVIGILVGSLISVILLFVAMSRIRQGYPVTVKSVANKSGELVNYTIPYMISFFAFDLGDRNAIFAFVFFLLLMYVLTVKTQNIFINPLLALRGWALYEVTFNDGRLDHQGTFLARSELRLDDQALVQKVARFFYVVTTVNPEV